MDGFDPSGLIILPKERYWLEQGSNVSEQVVPLVRNFNGIDVESGDSIMVKNGVEMKGNSSLVNKEIDGNLPKNLKEETRKTGFRSFGANLGGKGFLPIRQTQEAKMSRVSSSESLDDIFQRLKRPALDQNIHNDKDYFRGANITGPSR